MGAPRLTSRERMLRAMSEAELELAVSARCVALGIYRYHTLRSIGSESGFPDDVLVGTRVLFRELKTELGATTAPQRAVLDRLAVAGADVAVWRPSDLYSGRIDHELKAISPRH
jgi:hypothetical protein